ncbi:hypothetical protein G7046_g8231 [Stylonectria norvegica]|nr:hypothetical protein G7046_g8231 [Stylonectria norvegica]
MRFTIVTLALAAAVSSSPVQKEERGLFKQHRESVPFEFTSTFNVQATPDQVVDAQNQFTGGLAGAKGIFKYGLNSHEDIICYNITLFGFRGEYQSPAKTATHIHQGAKGKAGPPRIAFPNPEGDEYRRSSLGCLKGPFKTGVVTDGNDSGDGFTVKQIEDNPAAFFTDTHSSLAVPGAVRGQLDSGKC